MAQLSQAMPPALGIFRTDEDTKAVKIDARNPDKTVQIRASLNTK
jgi:hypothetical protein